MTVTIKGGTQDASLPGAFSLNIPVANGEVFPVDVEVDAKLHNGKVLFSMFVADIGWIEEEIKTREVAKLEELTKGFEPTPLILLNT